VASGRRPSPHPHWALPRPGRPGSRQTAFLLQASAPTNAGILFNKLMNTIIYNAQIGVRLWVEGASGHDFINANAFEFLGMWFCERFVSFQIDNPAYNAGEQDFGIVGNTFTDLECQSDTTLTTGVEGVTGAFNTFVEVKVWDVPEGQPSTIVTNKAYHTRIIGGLMTANIVDNGVDTCRCCAD
jgi:hypothetical protein